MKIFIYEYYAAGGMEEQEELEDQDDQDDQDDLRQAGFAMLNAVIDDFILIPDLLISTIIDTSLQNKFSAASYGQKLDIHLSRRGENRHERFINTLITCDSVLIIAPETDGILAELTEMAEICGKTVLGSCSQTLKLVGNKANILSLLKSKGLPVPESEILKKLLPDDVKARILARFALPLVIKPVCGTAGEGVRLVENYDQLDKVLEWLANRKENVFLLQEYIPGQAVSVSCFVSDHGVFPLSLNQQIIKQQDELIFQGVTVPYEHTQAQDILKTAASACELVKGLKGFVGVDLVVNAQGPVLMEINARITLAYVALREVVSCNLAQDLLSLCLGNCFPEKPDFHGTYTYLIPLQKPDFLLFDHNM